VAATVSNLSVYNTLTRSKEVFTPLNDQNVRMYVCGPTVYDFAHIGNARPVIVFDVLYRLLRHIYGENHVTYVRNITDLDDKINARAVRDFPDIPLNESIRKVTEKTANQFQIDMQALGNLDPTHQPRATDFVLPRKDGKTDMVGMIEQLIAKGHAYVSKGNQGREVLFRVKSMEDYGSLSNRNLEEQQAGARVAVEAHKENPADFVLWKESSQTEPGWQATFEGQEIYGRPGWHIECSAMSASYLGATFDIHGGGLDLIFPHHENELAQSRCCHGTDQMAQVWMHNGFLQVEGQKMSKSAGNFHTVNDVLKTDKIGGRSWSGQVVRLAMVMTHYREPIDFSIKRLEEAENLLSRWKYHAAAPTQVSEEVLTALVDDLNTSSAIQALHSLAIEANVDETAAGKFMATAGILGLAPPKIKIAADMEVFIKTRISDRLAAIADKNWGTADQIRDELLVRGIQLKDGKDAETGERTTTWELKR